MVDFLKQLPRQFLVLHLVDAALENRLLNPLADGFARFGYSA
jgi:hypothetical protein